MTALPALAENWLTHLADIGYSEHTVSAYASDMRRWLPVHTDIERARAIRESGLAPRTIARHLSTWSAFYTYECNRRGHPEWLAKNPYLRRPRIGTLRPAVVPEVAETEQFLTAEENPMYRAAFALMAGAGLRVGEVCALRWSDFHTPKLLWVRGKGDLTREVPLSDRVARAVWAWGDVCEHATLDRAFPVTTRSMQRRVKRTAVKAGLPATWHPHALRHGFGTAVYEGTKDLLVVGELLGHTSTDTTKIYAHIRGEAAKKAVEFALPA